MNAVGVGKNFGPKEVADVVEMSNAGNREILYKIGVAASSAIVPEQIP